MMLHVCVQEFLYVNWEGIRRVWRAAMWQRWTAGESINLILSKWASAEWPCRFLKNGIRSINGCTRITENIEIPLHVFCDILLLAEPYFRLRTSDNLPISTWMINAEAYLLLTDSVIDKLEHTDRPELRPARDSIQKYRKHKKKVREGRLWSLLRRIKLGRNDCGKWVKMKSWMKYWKKTNTSWHEGNRILCDINNTEDFIPQSSEPTHFLFCSCGLYDRGHGVLLGQYRNAHWVSVAIGTLIAAVWMARAQLPSSSGIQTA